jgi:hypothetical protein
MNWRAYEMTQASELFVRWRVGNQGVCVAGIALTGRETSDKCRAELLAAAPELRDALRRAVKVLDAAGAHDEANQARAALAKADGVSA